MDPLSSGYLDTEGLHLYYETYGAGTPVVLLHGGVLTIELSFAGLIPVLAEKHLVIAMDAQGHGRSSDSDRDIKPETLARDVVALLDHLGIERAHVLGHSMGGATTLELAVRHGERLLKAVPISASVRTEGGMHADFASPESMATSTRMPTQEDFGAMAGAYARLSPTPENFEGFMAKMQGGEQFYTGWSDEELAGITAPTLIILGDHDFTPIEHAGLMLELIPGSTLAVLPGTTHMSVTHQVAMLAPVLDAFLD
jgi:pimeloyl-ACP methyl ester carboxylesterase